ncbi:hypothetical protein HMPREF1870_00072 [Bacteroidales bacterium KA00344]|nr:hypothetical protein HMPREF1870_00072 [Bacteroidales bacterium KA00344]
MSSYVFIKNLTPSWNINIRRVLVSLFFFVYACKYNKGQGIYPCLYA